MASKAKNKKDTKKPVKVKPRKMSVKAQMILAGFIVLGTIFLSTTLVLFVGMLPTPAAALWDRGRKMTIVVAVGAMNLAGCTPYLLKLWSYGNSFDKAFDIVSDPMNIVVMYAAAGVGYVISWAMTDITASILYKRGRARQREIRKIQGKLVERWGKGVTGEVPLDPEGFPVE